MQKVRASIVQQVLNDALKILVGSRSAAASTIGLELNVPTIWAVAAAARARAYTKYTTSRTMIGVLTRHLPTNSRKKTWTTGTKMWLKTYAPVGLNTGNPHHSTLQCVWSRELKSKPVPKSLIQFQQWNYHKTCEYLKTASKRCVTNGIKYLLKLRIGSFFPVSALVNFTNIPYNPWRYTCPCCLQILHNGETLHHLMVSCNRWDALRHIHIESLIQWVSDNVLHGTIDTWNEEHQIAASVLLLGGSWDGFEFTDITIPRIINSIPNWVGLVDPDGTLSNAFRNANGQSLAAFELVGNFLAEVLPLRQALLSDLE